MPVAHTHDFSLAMLCMYLIRHAHPAHQPHIPYDRPPGPPLSERGILEAQAAAQFLESSGIEHLFASPLERTMQTARIIAEHLGLGCTVDERLAEHRFDEEFAQVHKRMQQAIDEVATSTRWRCVAFVTHGSPIRAALQYLAPNLDLASFTFDNGNCAPTAGVWELKREAGTWQAELVFRPQLIAV